MFGSSTLEVAIGVVFVYLLLSLICTGMNEMISSVMQMRGKNLFEGVKNLLNDPNFKDLAKQVFGHGLIGCTSENTADSSKTPRPPSYISAANFSLALLDTLEERYSSSPLSKNAATAANATFDKIRIAVNELPAGHTQQSLIALINKTAREVADTAKQMEELQKNIEAWFNDAMDRVSGWYKRWTQVVLLFLAAIVVCSTNADTIMLVQRLTSENALRTALDTAAIDASKQQASGDSPQQIQAVVKQAKELQLPLGWTLDANDQDHLRPLTTDNALWWFKKAIGLLISILAVSMGAPFWFDTLSKVINLRGSGPPPNSKGNGSAS